MKAKCEKNAIQFYQKLIIRQKNFFSHKLCHMNVRLGVLTSIRTQVNSLEPQTFTQTCFVWEWTFTTAERSNFPFRTSLDLR